MPVKYDQDSTPGVKLLRLFRKLLVDGRRHYQADLAAEFNCSPQTIIRLMVDIETVIGANLETGTENRRRWYRMVSNKTNRLGLEYEELRYLSVCRDLASPALPEQIRKRVDDTIFTLSVLMSEQGELAPQTQFAFFSKGRIDYTPHYDKLEKLLTAVTEKRVCHVLYKASGRSEAREHCFAPGTLISMSQAIYVLGALLAPDYSSVRHFTHLAVHRMQDVVLTDRSFNGAFPDVDGGTFGLPWHEPKEFHIRFKAGRAADYVCERVWADRQKMEMQDDGSVILHITTRSEPELMAWVRSFGGEAWLEDNSDRH